MLSVLYQLSRNYQKQESHLQSRYLSQYCIAKSILHRYVSACICIHTIHGISCYSCQDDGVQSAMTYHDVTRLQAVYNLLSLYMHNDSNSGNCSEMLKSENHFTCWMLSCINDCVCFHYAIIYSILATCEANKTETSLQMIFQMLPVKELLSVPVIHQVQPHLLWTIDYTVRIASRLAKKELQKVQNPSHTWDQAHKQYLLLVLACLLLRHFQ